MSHGKGEVDRMGGIVKRAVHNAFMAANTWLRGPSSVQTSEKIASIYIL